MSREVAKGFYDASLETTASSQNICQTGMFQVLNGSNSIHLRRVRSFFVCDWWGRLNLERQTYKCREMQQYRCTHPHLHSQKMSFESHSTDLKEY